MASPTATQSFTSEYFHALYDHDPDTTNATLVSPDGGTTVRVVDMRDYENFTVSAMSSTLTGNGITLLEIVASDSSDMSTNVTQIKTSGTIAADAVGDHAVLSCDASELAQESADGGVSGPALRYVAGRITVANTADEAVVAYIAKGKRQYLNQTPATTIA